MPAKPGKKMDSGKKDSNVSVDESKEEPASDLDDDNSSIASIFKDSDIDESDQDMPKPGQKRTYGQSEHPKSQMDPSSRKRFHY